MNSDRRSAYICIVIYLPSGDHKTLILRRYLYYMRRRETEGHPSQSVFLKINPQNTKLVTSDSAKWKGRSTLYESGIRANFCSLITSVNM